MAAVLAICLVFLASVLFAVWRSAHSAVTVGDTVRDWRELPERLGAEPEEPPVMLPGIRHWPEVHQLVRTEDTATATVGIHFEVIVHRSKNGRKAGESHIHPTRVRALLTDPEVMRLLRIDPAPLTLELRDEGLRLDGSLLTAPADLATRWDTAIDLARRLQEVRKTLPPPEAREAGVDLDGVLRPAWRRVAGGLGLTFDEDATVLRGRHLGADVRMELLGAADAVRTAVTGTFDRSLNLGLEVRPKRSVWTEPLLGQDITLGDETFDRLYVVKAWATDVQVRFDFEGEPLERLTALAEAGASVVMDDAGLVVVEEGALVDDDALAARIGEVARITLALSGTPAEERAAVPYRSP
jgi:hypothetical protein